MTYASHCPSWCLILHHPWHGEVGPNQDLTNYVSHSPRDFINMPQLPTAGREDGDDGALGPLSLLG